MSDSLGRLFSGASHSPQPTPAGPTVGQPDYSHLDAQARAHGFHDGAQMMAWAQQRNNAHGGTTAGGQYTSDDIHAGSMLYPPNLLRHVQEAFTGATGNN